MELKIENKKHLGHRFSKPPKIKLENVISNLIKGKGTILFTIK